MPTYKHLQGYTDSDSTGRYASFVSITEEEINELTKKGWRVVSCGFTRSGDIAGVLLESQESQVSDTPKRTSSKRHSR